MVHPLYTQQHRRETPGRSVRNGGLRRDSASVAYHFWEQTQSNLISGKEQSVATKGNLLCI